MITGSWVTELRKDKDEVMKVLQTSLFSVKKSIKSDSDLIRCGNDRETDAERKVLLEALKTTTKPLTTLVKARLGLVLDSNNLIEILATKTAPPDGFAQALKVKMSERPAVYKNLTDGTLKSDVFKSEHLSDYQCLKDVEVIIKQSENSLAEGDVSELYSQVDPALKFKCSFTKVLMVDPYKITTCGHSFSKAAVHQIVKAAGSSKLSKCPKAGCNKPFKESDLIKDEELAEELARYKSISSGKISSSAAGHKRMRSQQDEGEVIDDDDDE